MTVPPVGPPDLDRLTAPPRRPMQHPMDPAVKPAPAPRPPVKPVAAEPTALAGVLVLRPPSFGDDRGHFRETYHRGKWAAAGVTAEFAQDNQSLSRPAGTVRGLHYQLPPFAQAKLVRCTRGRILDVAVDVCRRSPTFGRHVAVELTADGGEQMYVPIGFAHGFATLEPDCEVCYKCSAVYDVVSERGIAWDDPALGIDWRVAPADAVLSGKDRRHPPLAEQADLFE